MPATSTAPATRAPYIPRNTVAVPDPHSDAVIYVGRTPKGAPIAAAFFGKQSKPAWNYIFKTQAQLEAEVARTLTGRRAALAAKAKWAAERKAQGNPWAAGDIAYVSWGYDQTNVTAYQCVAAHGFVAEFRKIACTDAGSACSMSGHVLPQRDQFCGAPIRIIAKGNGKIDGQGLTRWDGQQTLYTSSYA